MNDTLSSLLRTRLVSLYIFLFCATLIAIALYMQYGHGMEPCPLCMMQRIFFMATGLFGLIAFIHNPGVKGKIVYGCLTALVAASGGGFAIRQIYLQSLPEDKVPACGPSLSYMMEQFPLQDVISVMFSGDGNCAEVVWQDPVLQMSIPQWSLVGFVALTALSFYQILRK